MKFDAKHIVFWQQIVSPHMAGLAKSMVGMGWTVHYVAERLVSADRKSQGWDVPELREVCFHQIANANDVQDLISSLPLNSIHICQGFRGNGYVRNVQKSLAAADIKYWVIMETVDDSGLLGVIKRAVYKLLIASHNKNLIGILATGHKTRNWLINQGADERKVFLFAYFLAHSNALRISTEELEVDRGVYKFAFIGQLIERKRVGLLLSAFSGIPGCEQELLIVGNGPLEAELKYQTESKDGCKITWLGVLPMSEISGFLATVDCLVLPSKHDGWGAVVSEALLSGARVICSDACGAAEVVKASGFGKVFRTDSFDDLQSALTNELDRGKLGRDERRQIAEWAECLNAESGARYLASILNYSFAAEGETPVAPWNISIVKGCDA